MSINILLAAIVTVILALNIAATAAIARDSFGEPRQRWLQLLFAWLLPLFGSLVVLAVHRAAEEPSRKYRETREPEDEIEGADTAGDAGGADGD